jgi:4-diphosphocytidyl-2-C-methyl-D-erythritol kinase
MSALRDTAFAKLNLTLEVLGRRPDGFHAIRSLVAFAELGDSVELDPQPGCALVIEGPFATALGGDNLVLKAAKTASERVPGLKLGHFRLTKLLPVAAGLGGGSADAAAALRLIARANARILTTAHLAELAPELGSDVRVCLESRPAVMTGRGEQVEAVPGFPTCGVLLANPRLPLATAAVYAALRAETFTPPQSSEVDALDFGGSFEALLDYTSPRGNDLEEPAARLVPEIRDVLAALLALEGVRLARLSGSGPTCFALFATENEAKRAGLLLAERRPNWWIAASLLRASGPLA